MLTASLVRRALSWSMNEPHDVYALFDPRQPERIRYVGVTFDRVRRYDEHARKMDGGHGRKSAWLAELASEGVQLGMRILSTYHSYWRRSVAGAFRLNG
jgi:hypothetical protein